MNWIVAHFQRYRQREPWDFCWRIALEGTVVSVVAAMILSIFELAEREIDMSFPQLMFAGVIVAPVLETFVLQVFPVWIARKCKAKFSMQVVAALVVFFVLHAVEGVGTAIAAGLVGGFYFAFTYVHWREQKRWTAFWATAVSHAIHNGILIPLAFISGEL